MDYFKIGKKISYLLRHNPEDLSMDEFGYVHTKALLKKLQINQKVLDYIVETNDKKRFEYSADKFKIRASQGHSIDVDLMLNEVKPPLFLYHGTCYDSHLKIKKSGEINKMKRHHVHLTDNVDVAYSVGKRYSKEEEPVIYKIDSDKMYKDGYKFYISANKVYLTENVPISYIINEIY